MKTLLNLFFKNYFNTWTLATALPVGLAAHTNIWWFAALIPIAIVNVIGLGLLEKMDDQ